MIPFPGESVAIFKAHDVTAGVTDLAGDIYQRAASAALPSGHQWRAWVATGDANYLEDSATPVTVAWVVEVLEGTATVTASEGADPDYGDDAAPAPTSLGTHTLTAGTNVIPSTFTAADVLGEAGSFAMMLVLDAGTSSAVVQQIKLRVWPAAGVAGGWSDTLPGFSTDPHEALVRWATGVDIIGSAVTTDAESAWNDAHADFLANLATLSAPTARTVPFTGLGSPRALQQVARDADLVHFGGTHQITAALGLIFGDDWHDIYPIAPGLVEGVDWIVPPNEVRGDSSAYVQQVGEGSTGWANAVATVSGGTAVPGVPTLTSVAGDYDHVNPVLPVLHGSSTGTMALDTNGRDIFLSVSHTLALGAGAEWPGVTPGVLEPYERVSIINLILGADGVPVLTYAIAPPYRVWTPSAVMVYPHQLIQRGDHLGMGSGRALDPNTRQSSGRVLTTY